MPTPDRLPVIWIGSSLDDLKDCPEAVKDAMGKALLEVQLGYFPTIGKRLKGQLGGLVELVEDAEGGTYRGVYTAKLAGAIYVLHVFQKEVEEGHRHAAARDRPDFGATQAGEGRPRGTVW